MVLYKNILIIQTAFIGDAILASSLLEKLHHCFPQAHLSILVRKGNESIYSNHPFLKEVLVWNKTTSKYANLYKLLFKIRKSKFDCVINCHRFASSGFLTAFSGARHKTGYIQTPFSFLFNTTVKHVIGNGIHETERYNALIEDFTDNKVFKPKLYPSEHDFEKVKHYKQNKYVCLAPASVWFTKQLGKNKWVELCDKFPSDTTIYLLGAANDDVLCETIISESKNKNCINLAGKINLLQSCALIKDAEMNYVNDSAPLHLASAMNAPVKAFFCSTVPAFGFTPLSDNREIIEVLNLECRPCGLHGYKACPKGHFKCSNDIVINTLNLKK
jgi:ADP-heptose:LPS heptosyltransferase